LKRGLTFQTYMEYTQEFKKLQFNAIWKWIWWNICELENAWTLSKIKLYVSIMVCLCFFATLLCLCMFQLFSMTCDFLWTLVMVLKKVVCDFYGIQQWP
jgi:hypothetical protein